MLKKKKKNPSFFFSLPSFSSDFVQHFSWLCVCVCVSLLKFKIPLEHLPFVGKAVSLPLAVLGGLSVSFTARPVEERKALKRWLAVMMMIMMR